MTVFQNGYSQQSVITYKKVADKSIYKYFDSSLQNKLKCEVFKTDRNNYIYEENKTKKLFFSYIRFEYSYFVNNLNCSLSFYVIVDKNKVNVQDSSILKNIPICIRTKSNCNFINSDSAIKIAINDCIQYPSTLSFELRRNKKDGEFYWVITGHKYSRAPETHKHRFYLYTEGISTSQQRIIDSKNGKIINWQDFAYDF